MAGFGAAGSGFVALTVWVRLDSVRAGCGLGQGWVGLGEVGFGWVRVLGSAIGQVDRGVVEIG